MTPFTFDGGIVGVNGTAQSVSVPDAVLHAPVIEAHSITPAEQKHLDAIRQSRVRAEAARAELEAEFYERNLSRRKKPHTLRETVSPLDTTWVDWVGDYLDAYREEGWWTVPGSTADHKYGAQWPFFRTEQQLGIMRSGSRLVAGKNNHAIALVGTVVSFAIGEGMRCRAVPKDGTNDPSDIALCNKVAEVIEEFEERTLWSEYQQDVAESVLVDGEHYTRLFDVGGRTEIRRVWPELIRQPAGSDSAEWSFGHRNEPGDIERTISYAVHDQEDPAQWEEVPASEIVYFPLKLPGRWSRGIKRSMPLFVFGTRDDVEAAAKLARNLGTGAAVRAGFAYGRQWETASQSSVDDFVRTQGDYTTPRPYVPSQTRDVAKIEPGQVFDVPAGVQYLNPPTHPETGAAGGVLDILYRSVGQPFNAPEWAVSGNASNMGAYTSSLVAEAPFVKRMKMLQGAFRARLLLILRAVVRNAVRAGLLSPECETRVRLQLTPQTVEVRDKNQEAQRNNTLVQMGAKSRQEVCEEDGRDFERTFQDNVEFQRKTAEAQAEVQKQFPGAGQPGDPGADGGGLAPGGAGGGPAPGDDSGMADLLAALGGDAGDSGGDAPAEDSGGDDLTAMAAAPLPGAQDGKPDDLGDLDPFGDTKESLHEVAKRIDGMTLLEVRAAAERRRNAATVRLVRLVELIEGWRADPNYKGKGTKAINDSGSVAYGERARKLLAAADKSGTADDDKDGGGSKSKQDAKPQTIQSVADRIAFLKKSPGGIQQKHIDAVAEHMSKLTKKDITALKKQLGVKASGAKAALAKKIAERALGDAVGKKSASLKGGTNTGSGGVAFPELQALQRKKEAESKSEPKKAEPQPSAEDAKTLADARATSQQAKKRAFPELQSKPASKPVASASSSSDAKPPDPGDEVVFTPHDKGGSPVKGHVVNVIKNQKDGVGYEIRVPDDEYGIRTVRVWANKGGVSKTGGVASWAKPSTPAKKPLAPKPAEPKKAFPELQPAKPKVKNPTTPQAKPKRAFPELDALIGDPAKGSKHPPGSDAKIALMRARIKAGLPIFHADDAVAEPKKQGE